MIIEVILFILILILVYYIIKMRNKKIGLENILKSKSKEKLGLKKGIQKFHEKAAISIDKIRTLKNENDLETFFETMFEILIDLEKPSKGYLLQNIDGSLNCSSQKRDNKKLEVSIDKSNDVELWNYLKSNQIIRLRDVKRYSKLNTLEQKYGDGYVVTLKKDEFNKKEIFAVILLLGIEFKDNSIDSETLFMDLIITEIELMINNLLKNKELEKSNKKLTEKLYNLMSLNFAAKMISSELEYRDIFRNSIDMFMEIGGAYSGAFLFYNENKDILSVKSVAGNLGKDYEKKRINISKKNLKNLKERTEIEVLNPEANSYLPELEGTDFIKEIKSNIYIPILVKDSFLGAILLGEKQNGDPYNSDNIELLNTLSTQVGVSLNNAKLYNEAIRDGMTNLYLNTYFKSRLNAELSRSIRYDREISLIMSDIDHFKNFNDTYGHQTGDKVLIEVANILKENTRNSDIVSRYGGEEFAIILPETGIDSSKKVAKKIKEKVEQREIEHKSETLSVTVSLGIYTVTSNSSGISGQDLIEKADKVLYYSKGNGRNQFNHFVDVKEKINGENTK